MATVKIIRILRVVLLIINLLICSTVANILGYISLGIAVVLGVTLVFASVVLTCFNLNINIPYNVMYAVLFLFIMYNNSLNISEMGMFISMSLVILIACFCWYLKLYEEKICKLVEKGGEEVEIRNIYTKQIFSLFLAETFAEFALVFIYYIVQNISARFIAYLYSINAIFSIPAIAGFLLIILISIFILVMYTLKKD
ncbi:MAG: hypothetical protein J6Y29_00110 [Clostridiales bacterium]|nr:hypothetical protein [Clostridiales bacterium]